MCAARWPASSQGAASSLVCLTSVMLLWALCLEEEVEVVEERSWEVEVA